MMESAILVEPRRIEMRNVAVPQPSEGGIVVRIRAALTDGTDLKAYRRGHPQMPMPTPFGHEFSGDVAATGPGVRDFAVGEAVMCVHSAPCGACFWCSHRQEELCEHVMSTKILGAYAEYIDVPAHIVQRNCYLKPADLSYVAAAFLEPLACVVHSVDVLEVRAGETVAVLGDGGFGFLHAMLVRARGAVPVLVGRHEERLQRARDLGISYVVNSKVTQPAAALNNVTAGRGADAVIECTGAQDVWESAPGLVRRGGRACFFGGLPSGTSVTFSAARLHYDEVRLISPFHFTPAAVRSARDLLVSGAIDPRPLITETVALNQITSVFERLDAGEGIKFAIEP